MSSDYFRKFEEKSLDQQAEEVTHDLVWQNKNRLFDFDRQDQVQRDEYIKELVGTGIVFSLVTAIDLRVMNQVKTVRNAGPMRKMMFLGLLNIPFAVYFNYRINNKYMDLKKFMV